MSVVNNFNNSGFSLVELVTVIVLLGILGVVAIGRFSGVDAIPARGFFDDTVNAVRFAQKLAISSGCDVQVTTTTVGYRLRQRATCTAGSFTTAVPNPADRNTDYLNAAIPGGFTLTAGDIIFDALGTRQGFTPDSADFVVSGGAVSFSFRVHTATGLVEIL